MAETLRADVVSNTSDAQRAFRDLAAGMQLSSREAKQLGQEMRTQAAALKTADAATATLARSDKTLRDAQLELAVAEGKLTRATAEEYVAFKELGDQADKTAVKTRLAGDAAKGAGGSALSAAGSFGALGTPLGAVIAAGAALSPVLLTVGTGLAGFGLAAYGVAKPIENAASKTGGLAANMKLLDPEQQTVARGILGLGKQFDQFQNALKPEVLGVFNTGLHLAGGLLHDVQPVAVATGKALGSVLGSIDAEFRSGTWQQFFGFMAKTAAPDVQQLGGLFTSLVADLPPLLEGLQPVATEIITLATGAANAVGILEQLSGRLADVGSAAVKAAEVTSGSTGPGDTLTNPWKDFTNFLGDVQRSIPGTSKLVTALGGGIDSAGIAAANAGAAAAAATGDVTRLGGAYTTYAGEVVSAQQPTKAQAANTYVLGVQASAAAGKVDQLNSAWSAFLGLSTSLVTAQIGVEGGLKTLTADAKAAGASFTGVNAQSQQLQSDFESNLVPGLQNVLNGMRKAGAGTHDLATVLATDLKPAADRGALANKALEQQVYDLAVQAGFTGPNRLAPLKAWIDRNATSAQNAANKVAGFGAELARLPNNKTVTLTVRVAGTGGEYITSTVGPGGRVNVYPVKAAAAGWRVPGSGNSDSVPAMLTPGEAVVPKRLVPAVAPFLAANSVPGFASGGIAGAVDTLGSYAGGYFSQANAKVLASALGSVNAKAAAALAQRNLNYLPLGPQGPLSGSAAVAQAFAKSIMFAYGWGQGQWPYLQALWNRESSWNAYAANPTSNARGIPQNINGWSAYAPGDYKAQVRWGDAYISSRYGTPQNAWAHELAFNWYDKGGLLKPGLTLAYNGTGRNEQVLPAGSAGGSGGVHLHLTVNGPVGSQQQLEDWFVKTANHTARTGRLAQAVKTAGR